MKKGLVLFLITSFILINTQKESFAMNANTSVKSKQKIDNNHYFTSNGIEVILKKETTNNIVGLKLFIKGGTRNLNTENAGIEKFLLKSLLALLDRLSSSGCLSLLSSLRI